MVVLEEPSDFPETVAGLPANYNFEIRKTLRTITRLGAKKVSLQFPDGLLCYAPLLVDTIERHTGAECVILDDVVYGACCVDDQSIASDILIHYGHSCLVPITDMETRVLYIFVDIRIDIDRLYRIIKKNFAGTVAVIGTIQFNASVNRLKRLINSEHRACDSCASGSTAHIDEQTVDSNEESGAAVGRALAARENACTCLNSIVPQIKPLSPGEVLGCTSPVITGARSVIYIGDGRFHLESAMIRNPALDFYKYCPFMGKMTREFYQYDEMVAARKAEIRKALSGRSFGVILGSLGRQGNKRIMENAVARLRSLGNYKIYKIIVDEINEEILDRFAFIDSFVQVSCPRLSIDWGSGYRKPLLSPFELFYEESSKEYQMDYYSNEGSAPWKNYRNDM